MARKKAYEKGKARSAETRYLGIPYRILIHPNFARISPHAVKLLVDIGMQYMGANNGDLCATWSAMVKRGWRSKETLSDAIQELEAYGLIVLTQQGGRNKPNLYALSWLLVDKSKRPKFWKTNQIPGTWKAEVKNFIKPSAIRRAARKAQEAKKKKVRSTGQVATSNVTVLGRL